MVLYFQVIQTYSTPAEKELRRDLDATIKPYITLVVLQLIIPVIQYVYLLTYCYCWEYSILCFSLCSFLSKCRPLSVSMGNAIKHLKLKISNIPPDVSEAEVRTYSFNQSIQPCLKAQCYLNVNFRAHNYNF